MKNINISVVFILLIILSACAEDVIFKNRKADGTPPAEVNVTEIIPRFGKLTVVWDLPQDDDFLYVKVSYPKGDGERVHTYSKSNQDSIIIPNLNDEEYSLTFKTVDISGTVSIGVTHKATPLKPAYKTASETVSAIPTVGAIIFDWNNPSGDTLLATVYVKLASKDSIVDIGYTGKKSRLRVPASINKLDYKIEFKDPEQNAAVADIPSLSASPEIKFNRTGFYSAYTGYSSFMRVFDGAYDVHFAVGGPFPRTIPFEYNKPMFVSRILVYPSRLNQGAVENLPKEVEIWTSNTGAEDDYQKQGGTYTLKEVAADLSDWYTPRQIVLEDVPKCQYIKMVVNSTYKPAACVIGEIEVFGAVAN